MLKHTRDIGQEGEALARRYLEKKGLTFVAANWSCQLGEIDLIMQLGATRVFVEVRTRRETYYGQGLDTVAWQKQHKLVRAVKLYQQVAGWWGDARFDVVSIELSGNREPRIEHIEYAFTLDSI